MTTNRKKAPHTRSVRVLRDDAEGVLDPNGAYVVTDEGRNLVLSTLSQESGQGIFPGLRDRQWGAFRIVPAR